MAIHEKTVLPIIRRGSRSQPGDDMVRLGSLLTTKAETSPAPAELFWTCEVCGLIEPLFLPFNSGRWIKRSCQCQREARHAREEAERHQVWLNEQRRQTFGGWLGERWTDPVVIRELGQKTFATFDASLFPEAYARARAFAEQPTGTMILYGPYGVGKCVAASELITLANGKRVLAMDLIGQEFELLTLIDGKPTKVQARAQFNAIETVYQIQTKSGRRVIRNGDHPFWTARIERHRLGATTEESLHVKGWTPLRDIQPGDLIAETACLPALPSEPGPLSDVEIRVLAYLIGDGGYSRPHVRFTQQDNAQLAEFRTCVEEMGCSLIKHTQYDWRVVGRGRGRHSSNTVMALLKEHNMMGALSRDKRVPSVIWSLDARQLALFLSRLFSTDGWASVGAASNNRKERAQIGYCSASRGLVEDVQEALLRLGIYSHIDSKNDGKAWTLRIERNSEIIRFAEIVGIYGKEEAVERVAALASEKLTRRRNHRWYHIHAEPGTHWGQVESIVPMGIQATVAIEVPGPETFLTLFYEHNTHLEAAICNFLREERKMRSLFVSAPLFFTAYHHAMKHDLDYHTLLQRATQTPVLVLDDIDKARPTEARWDLYYLLIDERYKARRPTILSTNKVEELGSYIGDAALSRLSRGVVYVEMIGTDYRQEEE